MRHPGVIARVLFVCSTAAVAACGGGDKKPPAKPEPERVVVKPPPKAETEEDRAAKRLAAAHEIVPEGSNCLPPSFKESGAPALELAAVEGEAVICATDTDGERRLGPIGCWKVDVADGKLAYQAPAPLPGRGFAVGLDKNCARGFCLPKDDDSGATSAHIVWSPDKAKVAVLAGDNVHLYDAGTQEHESAFSIRGDKGVTDAATQLAWVGGSIFVGGGANQNVWVFKADGTAVGPIEGMGKGAKALSTKGGAFVVLDKTRVGVAEQGYATVTTYEADTGKRAKLVRKVAKAPCKAPELAAFWSGEGDVGDKCKAALTKQYGHLIGADAVAGRKSLLVLLRGPRVGELAVVDAKSLAEKKAIKLAWCEAGGGEDAPADAAAKKKPEDPDAGGE